MKQLVSILIPAFNAERWISDCLQSAIAQTWTWKEIIVVDDGSKDATFEIASKFESSNVQVVKQAKKGASAARNYALSLSQGDYIQWLDADDLLAPDKIARQLEGAEHGQSSRVMLSAAWGRFYYCPEMSRFHPNSLWEDLDPVEWLFRKVNQNLWMAIESWLISRKLTDMAGSWDETLYRDNDGEYFSRVLLSSVAIRFNGESRVFCRRGNFGISHDLTMSDQKLNSLSTSLFLYIQRLRAMEDSPRTQDACLKLLGRWSIYFYPERMDIFERMQLIANGLDGQLAPPRLLYKYRWLQSLFGWHYAKKAQHKLRFYRTIAARELEHLLFLLKPRNTRKQVTKN
jgi:glycosyltransferase involved in cell wall biosynthesis